MNSEMPSQQFRESLRWILSESGQLLRLEASATTYIRSLEGGAFCVGEMDLEDSIIDEKCHTNVDEAIEDYIERVTKRNDW